MAINERGELCQQRREEVACFLSSGSGCGINKPLLINTIQVIADDAFGKFRTATALHQADWPVVEIDRQNPAYSQSAANVGQTYQQFMTVMRALMQR